MSFHSISIYGKISARIGLIRTAGIGKGYVRDHAPRLLNATPFFKVAHPRQASPRLFFRRHRKEGIMRIAVSQADLNSGRFSAISKSLAKAWPHGKLSLMQAQGKLAHLLGYRSLHDLQQAVKAHLLSPPKAATREQITDSVAWKLSRLAPMPLADAREATQGLRLSMLEVDASTPEAKFEESQKSALASGPMLFLDESGTFFGPDWHPRTPELLDCGAPPYSFAVLPDKRAFSWGQLTALVNSLPADFQDDLVMEEGYMGLQPEADVFRAFVMRELLPQAFAPLAQTIKRDKRLPIGLAVHWLMNGENRVIGRVIENWALGGIIPVVYDAQSDDIFEALADLMCGQQVNVPSVPGGAIHINGFLPSYSFQGFDIGADADRLASLPKDTLQPLCAVAYWEKHAVLDAGEGGLFVEQGQLYIRHQQHMFLSPERIPAWLSSDKRIRAVLDNWPGAPGRDVFPAGVEALRSATAAVLQDLYRQSDEAAATWSNDAVIQAALRLAPAKALDQYLDDEAFIEDASERYALKIRGREVKEEVPELHAYEDLTVGIVWSKSVKGLLDMSAIAGILVYSAFCASSVDPESADGAAVGGRSLLLGAQLMAGRLDARDVFTCVQDLVRIERAVDLLESKRQRIFKWRSEEKALQQLRADGHYLIVGEQVPRKKPVGLGELLEKARMSRGSP
ncbi:MULTISPECIES: hypothetical protein [Acidovorax]|uniref:Uncharacterized protein n=1 Tax=Acidovorax facilis TaxID=12917 RepID=A0ABV8DI38_9BURK|nr:MULTISPECIES: hypothetical protein [Acidovorax]MBO1010767.1 hypothetical protein [Acidovorax sp. SD340]MCO4244767.1 hypothetical protein [Acidovorax facilis]